jgi:hypothetical protein
MIFIPVDRRPAIGSSLPCVCRYLRSGRFKDTAAELGCPTCTGQPATPGHPSSKPRSTRVSRSSIQATSRPWATPNCSSLWRDRRNGGSVATLSDSAGPARHRRPASPCPAMLRAQVTGATIRARLVSMNFIDLGPERGRGQARTAKHQGVSWAADTPVRNRTCEGRSSRGRIARRKNGGWRSAPMIRSRVLNGQPSIARMSYCELAGVRSKPAS